MKTKKIFFLIGFLSTLISYGQSSTENYVTSLTAREENTSGLSFFLTDEHKVQTDITYVDGLGRTKQVILREATPDLKDLVTPFYYDPFGRMDKDALPYKSAVGSGAFRSDWSTEHATYYTNTQSNGQVTNVNYPYSKRTYESSPLSRVIEMSAPGEAWKPSVSQGEHVVTYVYKVNKQDGTSTDDNVRIFEVDLSEQQSVSSSSYYGTGELYVVVTNDEDGNETIEYTNKSGLVVCKKMAAGTTDETITYYVYDIYDRLTFVISPKAVEEMGSNWSLLNDYSFRRNWLFRYRYDSRNRMIEKQVPGTEMTEMVYDNRDRLVFTLDGNRRALGSTTGNVEYVATGTLELTTYQGKSYVRAPNARIVLKMPNFQASKDDNFSVTLSESTYPSEWLYTKYDELNRPVITGIKSMVATRASLQETIDNNSNYDFSVSYVGTASGNVHGYDNSSYPSTTGTEILTVTYYDDYDFVFDIMNGHVDNDYEHVGAQLTASGLITGGRVRVLGSSDFLNSATHYDDRYRVIAVCSENYFGSVDKVVTSYRNDVSPLVTSVVTTHKKGNTSTAVTETFTYDHRDRLKTHTHEIDNNGEKTLAGYNYNDVGQLIEKDLHNPANPVQSVDYRYNERGWLTTINGGADNFDDPSSDKFGMELKYNDSPNSSYNGNIGQMLWKSVGGAGLTNSRQDYQYTYDNLNRLTNANYSGLGNHDVDLSYDKNGNILTLNRMQRVKLFAANGTVSHADHFIDQLGYTYSSGNQLSSITDQSPATNQIDLRTGASNTQVKDLGFEDGSSISHEYTYDKNGNMISDANKSITAIEYNYLNLPEKVTIDNKDVFYTYDATGVKHKKTYNGKEWTYAGAFHYEKEASENDAQLEFVQHGEGRVLKIESNWSYQYDLKDHLGNTRVTVDESGTVKQRQAYYPFGGTFNFSTTSPENLYKYNGKEEQKETEWLDYGARMLDPWLGRFIQVDPLANVLQESWTPYHYVKNNPIKYIDPTGMIWKDQKEADELKGKVQDRKAQLEKRKGKLEAKRSKREAKGKSTKGIDKSIATIDSRTAQLDQTVSDIDALGADQENTYDLVSGDNQGAGKHGVTQGSDGVINIYGSNDGLHVHEIRHVSLSLSSEGGLEFRNGSLAPTTPTGSLDEVEGYKAQFGYDGTGPGAAGSDDEILNEISNLKDNNGNYVYPAIRQRVLNRQKGIRNAEKYQNKIKKGKKVKFKGG